MNANSTIDPCIDCGIQTETVAGGSGRCGPCQYVIDRPPLPATTPLRMHRSGRLVPACRRCRDGAPVRTDPLGQCRSCSSPDPSPPTEPKVREDTAKCDQCGQALLFAPERRNLCARCAGPKYLMPSDYLNSQEICP